MVASLALLLSGLAVVAGAGGAAAAGFDFTDVSFPPQECFTADVSAPDYWNVPNSPAYDPEAAQQLAAAGDPRCLPPAGYLTVLCPPSDEAGTRTATELCFHRVSRIGSSVYYGWTAWARAVPDGVTPPPDGPGSDPGGDPAPDPDEPVIDCGAYVPGAAIRQRGVEILAQKVPEETRALFLADPCVVLAEPALQGPITENASLDPVFPGGFEIQPLGGDCARVVSRWELTHAVGGTAPVTATVTACARYDATVRPSQGPVGWVVTDSSGTGEPEIQIDVGTFPVVRGGGAWSISRGGLGNTGVLSTQYLPYGEGGTSYERGSWQAQIGFNVRFFLSAFFIGGATVDRAYEDTAVLPTITYRMLRN